MADPYLSEIRAFPYMNPPQGWMTCDGQFLSIGTNQNLFALLGTTYGGNGNTNFALPNLNGRTPVHTSETQDLGESGGTQAHTLTVSELPAHSHPLSGSASAGTLADPSGAMLARSAPANPYIAPTSAVAMAPTATAVGGGQAHENMQPFLALTFCICTSTSKGVFPS